MDWDLAQWATFRINATFDLSDKDVKAGDKTILTVPDALIITSTSFEIRDVNTKEVIAHATVDANNKTLTLEYTDYVEKHSDTNGKFFFYARVDFKKHPQAGEISIDLTVNKETKSLEKSNSKALEMEIQHFSQKLVGLTILTIKLFPTIFLSIVQSRI